MVMEVDINSIRKKYLAKALVDRKNFRIKMMEQFGYGNRTVLYKLSGDRRLTDEEIKFLKNELKLEN